MSRIGKQAIAVPEKTEVKVEDCILRVKGPLGEISRKLRSDVKVEVDDGKVKLTPVRTTRLARALWGTYASHINNMISGVNQKFEKKLVVEGIGFKAGVQDKKVVLNVGFSHPVNLDIPEGLEVDIQKNIISIKGIDKESVGQFAAKVRKVRKPEPYKGKGIRYEDEVVRRKQGKKVV